jgi:hypothetical protein
MRSPTKKGQLYGKYASGTPIRALARDENIPPSSVFSIIKDIERKGTAQITWNIGNEHVLSPADEERMIRHVCRSPKQTSDQIADYILRRSAKFSRHMATGGSAAVASPFCPLRIQRIDLTGPLLMRIRTGLG